jgi:hypothetical protein
MPYRLSMKGHYLPTKPMALQQIVMLFQIALKGLNIPTQRCALRKMPSTVM